MAGYFTGGEDGQWIDDGAAIAGSGFNNTTNPAPSWFTNLQSNTLNEAQKGYTNPETGVWVSQGDGGAWKDPNTGLSYIFTGNSTQGNGVYGVGEHSKGGTYEYLDAQGNKTGELGQYGTGGIEKEALMAFAAMMTAGMLGPALMGGAAGGTGTGMVNGAFLGEGIASGIPAWDAAYASALAGGVGGGGSLVDGLNGSDIMSDQFVANGANGAGGFGGGDGLAGLNAVNGSDVMSDNFAANGGQGAGGFGGNGGVATAVGAGTGAGAGTGGGTIANTVGKGLLSTILGGGGGAGGGDSGGIGLDDIIKLIGGGLDYHNQDKSSDEMMTWLKERQSMNDNMYKPGSPEYNALWDEMSRKDAAAGRNSQYGPRSVDLAARIAQLKMDANTKMTTGIGNFMANSLNQKASAPAGLMSALQGITGGSGGGGSLSTITKLLQQLYGGSGGVDIDFSDAIPSPGTGYPTGPDTPSWEGDWDWNDITY
jgi:hypothetical protein